MKCDVCGKNLTMPSGPNISQLKISAENSVDTIEANVFWEIYMGPYELNRDYHICGECTLRAFGVKPGIKK